MTPTQAGLGLLTELIKLYAAQEVGTGEPTPEQAATVGIELSRLDTLPAQVKPGQPPLKPGDLLLPPDETPTELAFIWLGNNRVVGVRFADLDDPMVGRPESLDRVVNTFSSEGWVSVTRNPNVPVDSFAENSMKNKTQPGRAESLVTSLLASGRSKLHEAEPPQAALPDNGGNDPDRVEGDEVEELDEQAVQQIVYDALTNDQGPEIVRVSTFEEEGIMTRDAGLVLVAADGTTWQLTIVQGRSR